MKIERIERIVNSMKDSEGNISSDKLLERLNSISIWELLTETKKIEIPIIQRDYAQGRNDEKTKKIRSLFLDNIIKAIEPYNESLELDFVYGDIKNGVFQPLDGQQRLTTLFLLYWYIAYKTGNLSENKNLFKKFTYETRISSREFCIELAENGENLGKDGSKSIQEQIVDSSWFFLSWKKDPTIKAILVMLNSIESKLKDKSQEKFTKIWGKLVSENPPITFHFKQLNDVGLTDDLYIKMNARGKQITDFENFKARFEKHIKEKEFEKHLSLTETFSHKIDTVWTDLFWKHREEDNLVDNKLVKFIAGIAINSYAQSTDIHKNQEHELRKELEEQAKGKSVTNEAVKRERAEKKIAGLFKSANEIVPSDFYNKKAFDYLIQCFEIYSKSNYDVLLPDNLSLWDFCKSKKVKINNNTEVNNTLFVELVKNPDTTYKQRVLFYAQTQFLLSTEVVVSESFSDWMRVVRNIVQNATIDSAGTYIGAIGLINELSKGCENIYQYLNAVSIKSGFASNQVKEEITKAKIIINNPDAKPVIHITEDTNFCKGKIKFPLYCIGFENLKDTFKKGELLSISKVISKHLDGDDISNDFRRLLFTIKDHKFYNYWTSSWLFAVDAPKRCMVKNIFELKHLAYSNFFKNYLKECLILLKNNTIDGFLDNYAVPKNLPNWKKRIIKEKGLLDFSTTHYFALKEDKCCWLIPRSKVANSKEGVKKLQLIV